jgi:urease accessory protein
MRIETLPASAGSGSNARDSTPQQPQLDLCFSRGSSGATYLSRQRAGYPFHVGRVLAGDHGSDAAARVIVQSSSGGLFEDDDVLQHLIVATGARARVETAAATIVHSMTRGMARSRVNIEAHADARLDWLPHPSILFPHARLASAIDVTLHPGAQVLIADAYTTHDPAGSETPFDSLDASVSVRNAQGRLLARDRFCLDGKSGRPLGGVRKSFAAHGGLMILTLDAPQGEAVAAALQHVAEHAFYAGAGLLPGRCGAYVRILAADSFALRTILDNAIVAARHALEAHSGAPQHASLLST